MKKAQKVLGKYGFCAGAILDLMACFCFVQVLDQASKKIQELSSLSKKSPQLSEMSRPHRLSVHRACVCS